MPDKKIHNAIPLALVVLTLIGFAYLVSKSGMIFPINRKEKS